MESLKRKPNLGVRKSMSIPNGDGTGTKIDVIGITARRQQELFNNKSLTDYERGIHLTASKLLVNGQPIVADDLLDCFTDDETTEIVKFANDVKDVDVEPKNG